MKNSQCNGCGMNGTYISTISDEFHHMKKRENLSTAKLRTEMVASSENEVTVYDVGSKEKILVKEEVPPRMITQVVGATIVALTHFGIGAVYGYPGITLPQLTESDNTDLHLSPTYAALFGSVVNVGAVFGGLASGPLVVRVGLQKSLLLALPLTLSFWLMLAFSPNAAVLIASRVGLGIMTAAMSSPSNTYVLEISHKHTRGILFAAIPTARQIGFLFVYSFGVSDLSWRHVAMICGTVTTVLPFIGLLFLPESPRWLASRGREEEAKRSLIFYRGKQYDSDSELNDIIRQVKSAGNNRNNCYQCGQLFKKSNLKILTILSLLTLIVSFNGSFAITTYLVPIFQASTSSVDAYTSAILVGATRVVGTLCYLVLIDRIGRRPLHIYSYVAISATHAILGGYFYVQNSEWASSYLRWLPLANIMVYTFNVGLGQPVIIMMQGELLHTNVRSLGLALFISIMFFGAFLVTQTFSVMMEAFGAHGTFWIYSATCMTVAVFSYFALPETNGLSLEEINDKQNRENNQHHNSEKTSDYES